MNLGSAGTRHGHRPCRGCPTERNNASPIAGWRQQTARHETVSDQAPRDSPVAAMNEFIEWPAVVQSASCGGELAKYSVIPSR